VKLQGKVAIVTGSATGIGLGIVQRFVREGAAVTVDYVKGQEQDARALVESLKAEGGKALAVQANVADEAESQALVDQTVQEFGRLDIMVNNAGIEHKVPFLDTSLELWQRVISVNLTGTFLCSRAAARQMVKQGGPGRIINISSVHEDLPMPTNSPYCASKGGIRMLMRTICVELAPHGITVNDIGPGAVDTPMDEELKQHPDQMHELLSEIPLGRMGQPDEIAGLAAFLASDEAAYITGSTYFIDGGMMRQSGSL
jgi:glucose 1-dehydrogenase